MKSYDDKVTASVYYFDISNNFDIISVSNGQKKNSKFRTQ